MAGIGDTVWLFDSNNRQYTDDEGKPTKGGPWWPAHWTPYTITGETRVSWILNRRGGKIRKKQEDVRIESPCWSEEEVQHRFWCQRNAWAIYNEVARCADIDTLMKIADLVGYKGNR